ncbi:MAG TPA: hypothetical protein VM238_21275 [Phycisphaerae bacterium]|nr:hypothetical protein [Phycisphaerae bacterium]
MERDRKMVLEFPSPASNGATWWQIWRGRAARCIGLILNGLGCAGKVRPISIDDPLTGTHLELRVGSTFTVIAVNGRDYYFRRLDGVYDGAGMGCGRS